MSLSNSFPSVHETTWEKSSRPDRKKGGEKTKNAKSYRPLLTEPFSDVTAVVPECDLGTRPKAPFNSHPHKVLSNGAELLNSFPSALQLSSTALQRRICGDVTVSQRSKPGLDRGALCDLEQLKIFIGGTKNVGAKGEDTPYSGQAVKNNTSR